MKTKNKNGKKKRIYDAMAYSLLAGGKRLRPVIMMMTAEMLGKNAKNKYKGQVE